MIAVMPDTFPRREAWAGCLVLAFLTMGCGPHRNVPVNVDVAHQTLKKALEQWQQGAVPEDLRKASPEIVVQDLDWSGGAKLLDFEVLGKGEPMDANLVAKVKLTLQSEAGNEQEKTVTYVVGTSPVLTVFRDMMK
ncbi:MAG: hypothetical protein B7Z55_03200 [Planctomycetales bacterium 12-60-4]|nr:MAG: hypothetical protein B7Z55_03200 [Planctomycetales bacterium 12-60-4]